MNLKTTVENKVYGFKETLTGQHAEYSGNKRNLYNMPSYRKFVRRKLQRETVDRLSRDDEFCRMAQRFLKMSGLEGIMHCKAMLQIAKERRNRQTSTAVRQRELLQIAKEDKNRQNAKAVRRRELLRIKKSGLCWSR